MREISKVREAVLATLRQLQDIREAGLYVKILWIPAHKGIVGNELAHQAAQAAGILAQARTGHTHLNEYRARIK
jgi:ribonuclease HI